MRVQYEMEFALERVFDDAGGGHTHAEDVLKSGQVADRHDPVQSVQVAAHKFSFTATAILTLTRTLQYIHVTEVRAEHVCVCVCV